MGFEVERFRGKEELCFGIAGGGFMKKTRRELSFLFLISFIT